MSKDIWHTELDDFEKEQGFCCLFFTKSEPKTLCLGCYNPVTQIFGNYMNHKSYLLNEIDKFANVVNLVHAEAELDRTRKALEIAIDTINKASDALIGCQEADDKYISDITAEDGLELLGKALGKIRLLQRM